MFCHKCGHELPENSKFCPKCGTPQLQGAKQSASTQGKYKYDANIPLTNGDPYKDDPRFQTLMKFISIMLLTGIISSLLICFIWKCSDLGYDYQVRNFAFIGVVVGIVLDIFSCSISRGVLVKGFHTVKAADAVLKYRRLEYKGVKYTDNDDDIEFVDYVMDRYNGRITTLAGFLMPFIATVFLYFISLM